jgi:hypothetical protein
VSCTLLFDAPRWARVLFEPSCVTTLGPLGGSAGQSAAALRVGAEPGLEGVLLPVTVAARWSSALAVCGDGAGVDQPRATNAAGGQALALGHERVAARLVRIGAEIVLDQLSAQLGVPVLAGDGDQLSAVSVYVSIVRAKRLRAQKLQDHGRAAKNQVSCESRSSAVSVSPQSSMRLDQDSSTASRSEKFNP